VEEMEEGNFLMVEQKKPLPGNAEEGVIFLGVD
jgi:hypothetical protein